MRERLRMASLAATAALALAALGNVAQADYLSVLGGVSGLVSEWQLNETSGNAADSVPLDALDGNNYGVYTGAGYTQGVAGPRPSDGFFGFAANNKAVNFADDNNTFLQMAVHSVYAGLKDASLITWVKYPDVPTASGDRRTVGGLQRDTSSGRYILCSGLYETDSGLNNAGLQLYVRRNNNTATGWAKHPTALSQWHMCVITFEGGQVAKSYIDGVLQDSLDFGDSYGLETPGGLVFGEDIRATANRPWKGELDEIAMFNRALTGTEVGNLWQAAKVPEPASLALLAIGTLCLAAFRRR